ncbi:threonylcarbamoyl-AMP synthase [Candidatus Saccharibacteria bacterium]|nr:threonylcarbamoyl-AMP synthase [Candidatus Saccharibacteria bacterium]
MEIEQIVRALNRGGVVGLPTETVFGLACALDSKTGVEKLMHLKNRPVDSGKVFTLVPESVKNISKYAVLTAKTEKIANEFFPGALTMILPKNPSFRHPYYDNFEKIGVRIPDFSLFQKLLPVSGPLLLTSANLRGEKPAKDAAELKILMPELDYIIDFSAGGQPPSTIIDFTGEKPVIIRQGSLRIQM